MKTKIDCNIAIELTSVFSEMIPVFEQIKKTEANLYNNILVAMQEIIDFETNAILKTVPIEALAQGNEGIQIKSLRTRRYNNIADMTKVTVRSLTYIKGIGAKSAEEIRKKLDSIIDTTKETVKIKLNADNKSKRNTSLVVAIFRYLQDEDYRKKAIQVYEQYSDEICQALKHIKPATNKVRWSLTLGTKREDAVKAYLFLKNLFDNECKEFVQRDLQCNPTIPTSAEAWKAFSKDTISFINVLEKIRPGMFEKDAKSIGLPHKIAEEVTAEPINLDGLKCTLRSYQQIGVQYILNRKRVLLGDEMGLGKTIQAIATMVSLSNNGKKHFLVFCPASLMHNWIKEITKLSVLTAFKIHGDKKENAFNMWIQNGGVAVTTFNTAEFFCQKLNTSLDLVVVDEAHYIKNPEAQRTLNVKGACAYAERLLFMTGTPLENKVNEMISLIEILQPQIAASIEHMTFMSAAPEFKNKVAPVYYRRKREDVLSELPSLIESDVWCTLNPEEEIKYRESLLEKHFEKIRKVSWNVDNLEHSSKAQAMLEIIAKAQRDDRKILVFSHFIETSMKVATACAGFCIGPICGDISPLNRQKMVDEFEKAPAGTVLISQIETGGTGLNIQSASVVIFCEPQYKPSSENQAIARAYRMGQSRNVLVYRLLCEKTIDEHIVDILENKEKIFDAFADDSVASEQILKDIIKNEAIKITE